MTTAISTQLVQRGQNGILRDVSMVCVVNPDGTVVSTSDGGGGLSPGTGSVSDDAWSGTDDGSVVAILKAIYAQNTQIIALLGNIRDNTAVS